MRTIEKHRNGQLYRGEMDQLYVELKGLAGANSLPIEPSCETWPDAGPVRISTSTYWIEVEARLVEHGNAAYAEKQCAVEFRTSLDHHTECLLRTRRGWQVLHGDNRPWDSVDRPFLYLRPLIERALRLVVVG